MIRPLTLRTVWQEQYERRRLSPFGAGRGEKLVNHHLGAVDKVSVLSFPDHQPFWFLDIVTILKANRGVLCERAVVDVKGGLGLGQGLQRRKGLACAHVVKNGMTL